MTPKHGKKPAKADIAAGESESPDPASPQEETSEAAAVALREFTPEQNTILQTRFDSLNAAIDAKIEYRFDKMMKTLENWMSGNAAQNAAQHQDAAQNQGPSTAPPIPDPPIIQSIETPHPPQRQTYFEAPLTSRLPMLKPKDVGIFNPDVSDEHGKGPVATISNETVYRDIYTWVERLKDLVHLHGSDDVRHVIQSCLRGSAATWWIAELTDEDRKKLRNAELQRWYSLLISRFKMQTSVALTRLISSSYSMRDLDRPPRIWIHQMLHYAKAAEMDSTYNQLSIIWNRLDAALRKDIPMPKPHTRLIDFLDQVDAMYPTWFDIKKSSYRQHGFQPQGPYQDRKQDPQSPQQRNPPPTTSQSQSHDRRGVRFENRPKMFLGKENGKANYAYMVDPSPDGTPQWADEDPDEHVEDDDYAP